MSLRRLRPAQARRPAHWRRDAALRALSGLQWPANGHVLRLTRAFILWGRPQKRRRPAPAPCPEKLAVMAAILSSKVQVQPAFAAKRAPVQRRASVAVRAGAIAAEDVPTPEKRTIMVRERPGGAGRAPLHRPPARPAACTAPAAPGWH